MLVFRISFIALVLCTMFLLSGCNQSAPHPDTITDHYQNDRDNWIVFMPENPTNHMPTLNVYGVCIQGVLYYTTNSHHRPPFPAFNQNSAVITCSKDGPVTKLTMLQTHNFVNSAPSESQSNWTTCIDNKLHNVTTINGSKVYTEIKDSLGVRPC